MQAKPSGSNYYETLGVVKDASVDLIKAAYQRLVMKLHPDKAGSESHEQFQQLQEAWQVLRDAGSRARYDHQLTQAELHATVVLHDEIYIDDMGEWQQQDGAAAPTTAQHLVYPCRCGDSYMLEPADRQLATDSIIIPCRSCSNHILVRLNGTPG